MHQISYRIRNTHFGSAPPRTYQIQASVEDLEQLKNEGYWIRPHILEAKFLQRLRVAADAIEAKALESRRPGVGGAFNGLFVRNILDIDPIFWELATQPALLSVARAMLGPQVQIHASVLRVAYPDLPEQGVEWHFHQRVVPEPTPPFFLRPTVLDNLLYLDDLMPENGPLVVMPKSHLQDLDIPSGDFADKPGQIQIEVPAGSCVTSHSSLWHKALSTQSTGTKRRLLILGYSPVWLKQIDRPSAGRGQGWTDSLVHSADEETCELLGLSGYY